MKARSMIFTAAIFTTAAALTLFGASASAQDNETPRQYRSLVFVETIARRGLECGLLRPWQSAALSVQVNDAAHAWTEPQRARLDADATAQAADMACEDETLNVWIEGAGRGFESEMLAHFIVIYAALSEMSPQITLFRETTRLEHHTQARDAIAAKLAELEAAGAIPEGGGPWPHFIEQTSSAATEIARGYESGALPERYTPAQIEALITGSVRVAELWLEDAAR